ncbi:flagellar M-ring protein [Roseivivax halodurans JCM 10272]|uniref:Flagellar M-ring protein n=1 Tax=Roseivivax halodurans JCM 10272 TaxID=1449350 RepID=X7EJM2_9RHOB|nr:flagellar basal-body MS-ring/collar protein FliF [Roseivivax halodurans]ETX16304.1 flagellar M-ring protein [Roseivivax halodurans JCM 10272]
MKALQANLAGLGRGRLLALGATGVGLLLAVFLGLGAIYAPSYTPLYGDLSPAAASRIVAALEQDGFDVELGQGGSLVSVPEADVARARMALADQGLPSEGVPGWELFDQSSGLGMNTFLQKVNRLRALEGEIARSIRTIDGIEAARVHLVLPEREAFSRTRPEATASVIVRNRAGYALSRRQALSIRALVASAVPDMDASKVTVLSASGETILAEDASSDVEGALQTRQTALEDRLARSVREIVAARVGAANVRVETNVQLSTERQVVRSESYDPDQQVVRSTETREEQSEGSEDRSGEVSVANGLPPELAGGAEGGTGSRQSSSQSNEIVNYEIGNTRTETIREPGQVARQTVAVLVNGIYAPDANGDPAYQERPAEELERIEALVRSAIGFDEARGDTVSVVSMEFVDMSLDAGTAAGNSLTDVLARNAMSILRGLLALAVVVAVLLFAVRPALKRALPVLAEGAAPGGLAAPEGSGAAQLPGTGRTSAPGLPKAERGVEPYDASALAHDDADEEDDLIALASVQGGVRKRRVQTVGELVTSDPDESLRVLRQWLAQGA